LTSPKDTRCRITPPTTPCPAAAAVALMTGAANNETIVDANEKSKKLQRELVRRDGSAVYPLLEVAWEGGRDSSGLDITTMYCVRVCVCVCVHTCIYVV
jgi:hypothetical protein